jgi:DHA2 family methylenomycin A resistance protein-like MFS transporter
MVILDVTALTVALPSIGTGLHAGVTGLQWITAGYTLVFAGLLLTGGALGDRLGARAIFRVGIGLFIVASLACGLAPDMALLLGARLAQGLGAALLVPTSLAMLTAAYSDRALRGRAVGAWGGIAGSAAAVGPVLGGFVVAGVGWRAVFLINVPVGVFVLWLTTRGVPEVRNRPNATPDLAAQTVGVVCLALLTGGVIEAGDHGWSNPVILLMIAAGLAAVAGFFALEHRSADPVLPLSMLRRRAFAAPVVTGLLLNVAYYGLLFVATLYFQQVRGYSALLTGAAILPFAGFFWIGSTVSGHIIARVGRRLPVLVGCAVAGAGMLGWLAATADSPYVALVAPMLATCVGQGIAMPAFTSAAIEAAHAGRTGVASGVVNAARQTGSALGVALFGTLVADRVHFVGGLHVAVGVGAGCFALGAALSLAFER